MHAVVLSLNTCLEAAALTACPLTGKIPLLDRFYLDHLVGYLKHHGITSIDYLVVPGSRPVKAELGELKASTYPIPLRFHEAANETAAYDQVRSLDLSGDAGPVLLGHDELLPQLAGYSREALDTFDSSLVFRRDATAAPLHERFTDWLGWAWLSSAAIHDWPAQLDRSALAALLLSQARQRGKIVSVHPALSLESPAGFLEAHHRLLEKKLHGAKIPAIENEDKLWMGEGCRIDPTANIVPPVFIGADCRIGPGTQIGPHVSVGKGCRIEGHCLLEEAVVLPESYVGEALELSGVIVEGDRLINARLETAVQVTDRFILSKQSDRSLGRRIVSSAKKWLSPYFPSIKKPDLNN